ncbi:MAG: thioesterase family protein [Myxococcota bacterium]
MALDDDIRLSPLEPGRFGCEISRNYWLVAGPNGGYLAALLAHAGDVHLADPSRQLRGLTVHYLSRPEAAPATLAATTLRTGRSVAFLRVDLLQGEQTIATATGTWALPREGVHHDAWPMPEAKPPEDCPTMTHIRGSDSSFPIHRQWDIRSITGVPFGRGEEADMSWWIRPPAHRSLDGPMLAAMADALPPPIFMVAMPALGVPTLDLTVHLRADLERVPWQPGDWILARFVTRHGASGYLEEDGELWTADGTLVAISRQLAIGA